MDFNWWRKVLDLILPRSAALQELEKVNSAEFWRRAEKSTESADQNIFTLFNYGDPLVRAAIWQIKYRNHQKIIRMLAEILYSQLLDELATLSQFANFTSPLLIPIPLSTPRLKSRGYNQSEELTRGIINLDKGKSLQLETGVLVKIKETPPQSSLSRALRLKNLRGAFRTTDSAKILSRNIILIDDVTTTGATLKEAGATLRRAGARKVIAFVVAH